MNSVIFVGKTIGKRRNSDEFRRFSDGPYGNEWFSTSPIVGHTPRLFQCIGIPIKFPALTGFSGRDIISMRIKSHKCCLVFGKSSVFWWISDVFETIALRFRIATTHLRDYKVFSYNSSRTYPTHPKHSDGSARCLPLCRIIGKPSENRRKTVGNRRKSEFLDVQCSAIPK